MHLRRAAEALWKLADSDRFDLTVLAQASVLLDGFERAGYADAAEGERLVGFPRRKIQSARSYFAILCGVGEDFDDETALSNLRTDLYQLKGLVTEDGLHLKRA